MKLIITSIVFSFLLCVLLSFKNDDAKNCGVFLSLDCKTKVALYNATNKNRVIKRLGHNFKAEDYLLFTLISSNDSMYYVEASYAIAGNNIKGWISKSTQLAIFSKAYDKKLIIYNLPNEKSKKASLNYTSEELKVLDNKKGWLKITTFANGRKSTGWLPPESQCSNPYTTCN